MYFTATVDTDIGTAKSVNQDSALIKHAAVMGKEIIMAIVCDGIGGLDKGELASAAVVRGFSKWFDEEPPYELKEFNIHAVADKWKKILKELNKEIADYGKRSGVVLGTTFTGVLFAEDRYLAVNVGDTRLYRLDSSIRQLTTDHTFTAREVKCGRMSMQQAEKDKRRSLLLQCIGAAGTVEPEVIFGNIEEGVYLLCSDGFRNRISKDEIYEALRPGKLINKRTMHKSCRYLIDKAKSRNERDNITALLIKADWQGSKQNSDRDRNRYRREI
ncbi:MAG: serine/threonine-protein phosphatase [Lachnospiraceae bacterium]|nr:serine/threonine-protein phosphatase [Lachnospiraceae bacterium]MDY6221919.1 PP2C family serine/threonine-protein phosphatase [Candidatus Alectryocaccobium sp.]